MDILTVGISYKMAPVEVREKLAFSEKQQLAFLEHLRDSPALEEKVLLSTCNRVEIYAQCREPERGVAHIKELLSSYHQFSLEYFERYLYIYQHGEAVKHLFRVSSSLDSLVVGVPQIVGQVMKAYFLSREMKATGFVLNQLFEKAFSVAKRVRTETQLGEHAVSVSFAAVELARKIFHRLEGKTVLLIGAGEMSELAARHLITQGVKAVLVANRTYERAVALAESLGGKAVDFSRLEEELVHADIVISSTGAPHYILTREKAEEVIRARRNRPIFLIDIAVPRDIDPQINEIENIYLYNIDDLHIVVQNNLQERDREAQKAEELIDRETWHFLGWLEAQNAVPTIKSLREKAEKIRQQEMEKTLARVAVSDKEREAINAMTTAIVNKLLHGPISYIKQQANSRNGFSIETIRQLFDLDRF
ncbi:MAG: glutamyl-tRNA reductase [Candidatus Tectomicrobia bacterium]|uniref:Glutamyl-tRNA reductase n=1 Tax=Tectimicrobiota bacterium TaxID=2528274 RepID=A0A932FXH7_UNCTE|nr:glutamyl-tRNA reductase [Candidatus Tectomicrobia bacterium]